MDNKNRIKTQPAKDGAKSGIWKRPCNRRRFLHATLGAFLRVLGFGVVLTIVLFAVKLLSFALQPARLIWDALSGTLHLGRPICCAELHTSAWVVLFL